MSALDRAAVAALVASDPVARLLAVLDDDGEEARIVGGAVRDALLGRPTGDIDVATTALPRTVLRRAGRAGFKTAPTGIAHGTVTVVVDGRPFEVTTLREDVETDGRHAVVRFGRDFEADAQRRDFTMNALSADRAGRLHDATGGLDDLRAGRVRFIGDARTRIREDYLRTLRFFRFHAGYATGALDREGLDAALAEREGLASLSRERVRVELLKLLAAPRGPETAAAFEAAGFAGRLGLGAGEAGRLARAAAAGADPVGRLAAFLVRTREDSERLQDALRLSNAERDRLAAYADALAATRSPAEPLDRAAVRRLAAAHGVPALRDVAAATAGDPRPAFAPEGRAQLDRFLAGAEPAPAFPLTGAELIRRGATPGPALGRALAATRAAWMAAGCPPEWESVATAGGAG